MPPASATFGGRSSGQYADKSGLRPTGWFSEDNDGPGTHNRGVSGAAGTGAAHGDVMSYGSMARDANYHLADNDADNFDPTLNSSNADYFKNPDSTAAYGENRWKSGGGIDTGAAVGLSMGRTRDTDGTVDRVKDPGPELYPILYAVRMQASAYNIDLDASFEAAGGNARGTIPTTRFCSALSHSFHRLGLTEDDFLKLIQHYGTGDRAAGGGQRPRADLNDARAVGATHECIAWKDFIEDVNKAHDPFKNAPSRPGGPKPMFPRGVQYG